LVVRQVTAVSRVQPGGLTGEVGGHPSTVPPGRRSGYRSPTSRRSFPPRAEMADLPRSGMQSSPARHPRRAQMFRA
jgi:hypothetical protein